MCGKRRCDLHGAETWQVTSLLGWVTLALAIHVVPLQAQGIATPSIPDVRTGREFGLGVLGGLGGGIAVGQAGRLLGDAIRGGPYQRKHDVEFGDPYAATGWLVGQSTGSALGVYYAGRMDNVQDSFGQTLIGATVGEAVGAAVYFGIRDYEGLSLPAAAVMVLAAPIGAVIGFNRSRHVESRSAVTTELRRRRYQLFTVRLAF